MSVGPGGRDLDVAGVAKTIRWRREGKSGHQGGRLAQRGNDVVAEKDRLRLRESHPVTNKGDADRRLAGISAGRPATDDGDVTDMLVPFDRAVGRCVLG